MLCLEILASGKLAPGRASKFSGRLAFLNSYLFNRIGRALLRPFIWRQRQHIGGHGLTPRLRHSVRWFRALLAEDLSRKLPLVRAPSMPLSLVYSDAEGNGRVGAVASLQDGSVRFLRGRVPSCIRRSLVARRTNIVAFELIAAMVAILSLCPDGLRGTRVVHFIDNKAALACVVRGFSRHRDLAAIAGRLWFEMAVMHCDYRAEFVPSGENLADGPSRDETSIMEALKAVELVHWTWPAFGCEFDSWRQFADEACRAYS